MAKVTLDSLANLQNESSAVATINTNNARVSTAMENTLSRDGTAPNEMGATLDMNSHRIINLPAAVGDTEPIRKAEFDETFSDIISVEESVILAQQAAADAAEAQAAAESIVAGGTAELDAAVAAAEAAQAAAEAAADALDNITEIQGLDFTLADAGADAIFGWDDSANAYENLTAAEATAILNDFIGDSGAGGTKGLVPAPAPGDSTKYLRGDKTWQTIEVSGSSAVADRTILKALNTTDVKFAFLNETGREGAFVWKLGNYTALVGSDANEGIYIEADDTAASSGAWVRAYTGPSDPSWFGGSVQSALELTDWVHLKGSYSISSMISITKTKFKITSDPGTTVTFTGSSGTDKFFYFYGVNSVDISGPLLIDCDDKVGVGFDIRGNAGATVKIDGVTVRDCYCASPATSGAQGIQILGIDPDIMDRISVTNCTIDGADRSVSGAVCAGITACDAKNILVKSNIINDITCGNGTADADSIKVFTQVISSVYYPASVLISNNIITNFAGRAIKTQVAGNCVVSGNLIRIDTAITPTTSFRVTDHQNVNTTEINNKVELITAPTGSSTGAAMCQSQTAGAAVYTRQPQHISYINNKRVITKAFADAIGTNGFDRLYTIVATGIDTIPHNVDFQIISEEVRSDQTTPYRCGSIAIDRQLPATSMAAGARLRVKAMNNYLEATNFSTRLPATGGTAAHAGLGDLTGQLFIEYVGNYLPSSSVLELQPYTNHDCFTSSIIVRDNSVGTRGNSWPAPFDYSKLEAGNKFYVNTSSTPARISLPPSESVLNIERDSLNMNAVNVLTGRRWNTGTAVGAAVAWTCIDVTGYATVATDANFTLNAGTSIYNTRHTGTLTADRTITLSTTSAISGSRLRVTRTGSGAFNLSVGGLKNLVTNTWCEVVYDGSAWYLAAYGAL